MRKRGTSLLRVRHIKVDTGASELTCITNLTARLRVERSTVEHNLAVLVCIQLRN